MKICLANFSNKGKYVLYDTENGTVLEHAIFDSDNSISGCAYLHRSSDWLAFYEDSGKIIFQFGKQKLNLSEMHIKCLYPRFLKWGFFLILDKWYPQYFSITSIASITPYGPMDRIDEMEEDYFLLVFNRYMRAWKRKGQS
jgi:hypothetical protein